MKKFENSHVYSSGVFPDTTAVDASGPLTQDGSEWIKLGIDDDWGWKQALLSDGGITPSGVTETATVSDMLDAMKSLFFFDNLITGLTVANNVTDAEHDIDVATGKAMDSTNAYLLKLTSGLIKQIDASWAAGTNAGGLFTGSVAADTWYAVFAIRKDSDGSIDAGFDTSATAANIPGGYTAYRRIGWVLTDASSNILGFFDKEVSGGGVERQWDGILNELSATIQNTRALVTVSAPQDTIARVNVQKTGTVDSFSWVLPSDVTDFAPTGVTDSLIRVDAAATRAAIMQEVVVDSSSQIAYRSSITSASVSIIINTIGYNDSRV